MDHIDNLLVHVLKTLTDGLSFQNVIDSIKDENDSIHCLINMKRYRKSDDRQTSWD